MQLILDSSILEKLLHHAEFAAHLVGHLDDDKHAELISQVADRVDTVVHALTELLGGARTFAERSRRRAGRSRRAPRRADARGRCGRYAVSCSEPQDKRPESRRQLQESQSLERAERRFSDAVSVLRQLALRVDELAHHADELHEQTSWRGDPEVRRHRERLGHLISGAAGASEQGVAVCSRIAEEFVSREPQPSQPHARPEFRFSDTVSLLRQRALRVEALAHAANELHNRIPWSGDDEVRSRGERLGHLISDTAAGSEQLVDACSRIAEEFVSREPGA
jgi:hypothetical protein